MVSEESVARREHEMRRESEEEQGSSEEEQGSSEEEEEVVDDEQDEEKEQEGGGRRENKVVRDMRRYYCDFCGICRSKKALIAAHVLSHHSDKMIQKKVSDEEQRRLQTTCGECGKSSSKPAYLKQHMQSHSLEDSFALPLTCLSKNKLVMCKTLLQA